MHVWLSYAQLKYAKAAVDASGLSSALKSSDFSGTLFLPLDGVSGLLVACRHAVPVCTVDMLHGMSPCRACVQLCAQSEHVCHVLLPQHKYGGHLGPAVRHRTCSQPQVTIPD